jgi:hypothetical protein
MEEVRPVVTYGWGPLSPNEIAIDIAIDRPFNGFFGVRLVVPTPTGSEIEMQATILEWTRRRVAQAVGEAVNHVSFRAV